MITLKQNHTYRLEYKLQSGNGSWYRWTSVMTFLGAGQGDDLYFNLRPFAGTQTLPKDCILVAESLGPTVGRDDGRHRLKKSLGRLPKPDSD